MRPPVEFTTVDENEVDVSTREAWLGSLKPSTYGVWVFVDGDYVEYNSEQLGQIAVKLEEMNSDDNG